MMSVFARIIGEMFRKNPGGIADAVNTTKEKLLFDIRAEALSISARVLGGIVLCSVIVFALIKLGQRVDAVVMMSVDGLYISMALLAMVVIICTTSLFIIFRPIEKPKEPVKISSSGFDFRNILMNFVVGLNEGYDRSARLKHGEDVSKQSQRFS